MRILLAPFAFAAAALLACPAAAGDLAGRVHDAKARPLAGVAVLLPELGRETFTDADGRYAFADLPEGETGLAVMLENGAMQHTNAQVPAEGTASRNIFLMSTRAIASAQAGLAAALDAQAAKLAAESWALAEQQLREAETAEASDWNWRDDNA